MFCANCGSSIEGTPKFCPKCGAPIETAPVQTPSNLEENTPAPNQTFEPVETIPQQPTPPAVEFNSQEQTFNAQPVQTPVPVKKKGKSLKVWLTAGIITVLVAVLAIFNAGKIGNFFVKLFTTDEGYAQHVHEKAAEDASDKITGYYGKFKSGLEAITGKGSSQDTAAKGEIKLEVSKKLLDLVSQYTPTDLSWVKSASIGYEVNLNKGNYMIDLDLILNNVDLASAQIIVDMTDTKMIYITSEELLDTYISVPINVSDNYDHMIEMYAQIAKGLPEPEVVDKLINRYISVALNAIEDVEKESDTIEVESVKAKYDKYTITVDEDLLADMLEAILEEAKDDDQLMDVVEDFMKAMIPYMYGSQDIDVSDIMDEFEDGLDELADEIDPDIFGEFEFDYSFWVNSEGDIIGFEIEVEDSVISMVAPEKGKKSAFEFKIASGSEEIVLSGEAETSGGKKNGKYTLEVMGIKALTFELIDYDVKAGEKGYFNGAIEIAPSTEIMSTATSALVGNALPSSLASLVTDGFKFRIDATNSESESSLALSLVSGGDKLITLSTSQKLTSSSSIKVPSSSINVDDIKTPDQIGLDAEAFLTALAEKLQQAGVPSNFLSMIS